MLFVLYTMNEVVAGTLLYLLLLGCVAHNMILEGKTSSKILFVNYIYIYIAIYLYFRMRWNGEPAPDAGTPMDRLLLPGGTRNWLSFTIYSFVVIWSLTYMTSDIVFSCLGIPNSSVSKESKNFIKMKKKHQFMNINETIFSFFVSQKLK